MAVFGWFSSFLQYSRGFVKKEIVYILKRALLQRFLHYGGLSCLLMHLEKPFFK